MYYTKYRPQKFSELSKPNDAAEALMNQIQKGKTVHAYLFVGSRGIGKTTVARLLAKALNCKKISKKGDPCGKCDVCTSVQTGSYIDLIEIDAASNRGIDDIRDLRDRVKLAPSAGKYKVYIIDEVHMLTKEAFNALLKTLEEPPKHAVFILATTELHKVPDTIKSRCQVFKFRRATKTQLVKRLSQICKSEGVENIAKEDLEKIASASFGGFRDAETMLQQVVEGNLDPQSFVGLSSKQLYIDFVDSLIEGDSRGAVKQINKMVEDGLDLNVWVFDLLNYLRDLLFVKAGAHEGLIDVPKENMEAIEGQAAKLSEKRIMRMIEVFLAAGNGIDESMIPQLPLELAVIKATGKKSSGKAETQNDPDDSGDDGDLDEEESEIEAEEGEEDSDQHDEKVVDKDVKAVMSLEEVIKAWPDVIKATTEFNHSIFALLKSCKPIKVSGSTLTLEALYAFHKERVESPKNRKIIEDALENITGVRFMIKCKIGERPKKKGKKEDEVLTDYNVEVPALSSDNIGDIFDGGLPL